MMTLSDKVFYVFSAYGALVDILQQPTPNNIDTYSRLFSLIKEAANLLYEETGTTEQRETAETIAHRLEALILTTEDTHEFRTELHEALRALNNYTLDLREGF